MSFITLENWSFSNSHKNGLAAYLIEKDEKKGNKNNKENNVILLKRQENSL